LGVVQRMKANVSLTDSSVGLVLGWLAVEPWRAYANRGWTKIKLIAMTLIAIVRRATFAVVIWKPSVECWLNAAIH